MKDMPLSLGIHSGKNATLRALLASKKLLIAPGVFDCLTARLAEKAGAKETADKAAAGLFRGRR